MNWVTDISDWLPYYGLAGITFVMILYLVNYRMHPPSEEPPSLLAMIEAQRISALSGQQRVLRVFGIFVGLTLVVATWPAVALIGSVFWLLHVFGVDNWLNERKKTLAAEDPPIEPPLRVVLPAGSLAEIEQKSVVYDPLNATPQIAFGHLNPAWERFKQHLQPGDLIRAVEYHQSDQPPTRAYVIERGGVTLCEFVYASH